MSNKLIDYGTTVNKSSRHTSYSVGFPNCIHSFLSGSCLTNVGEMATSFDMCILKCYIL